MLSVLISCSQINAPSALAPAPHLQLGIVLPRPAVRAGEESRDFSVMSWHHPGCVSTAMRRQLYARGGVQAAVGFESLPQDQQRAIAALLQPEG